MNEDPTFSSGKVAAIVGMPAPSFSNWQSLRYLNPLRERSGQLVPGRIARYGTGDVVLIAVMLELTRGGIPPVVAAKITDAFYGQVVAEWPERPYVCAAHVVFRDADYYCLVSVAHLAELELSDTWLLSDNEKLRWRHPWYYITGGKAGILPPFEIPARVISVNTARIRARVEAEIEKRKLVACED